MKIEKFCGFANGRWLGDQKFEHNDGRITERKGANPFWSIAATTASSVMATTGGLERFSRDWASTYTHGVVRRPTTVRPIG